MNPRFSNRQLLSIPRSALAAGISLAKTAPIRAIEVTHRIVSPVTTATTAQMELAYSKSLRAMREIRNRATAPFRSSAPGPDCAGESVYPPILRRL